MRLRLTRTVDMFCCLPMSRSHGGEYLHINKNASGSGFNVHMGNIGKVHYCPYCGKKIEIVNDIP